MRGIGIAGTPLLECPPFKFQTPKECEDLMSLAISESPSSPDMWILLQAIGVHDVQLEPELRHGSSFLNIDWLCRELERRAHGL